MSYSTERLQAALDQTTSLQRVTLANLLAARDGYRARVVPHRKITAGKGCITTMQKAGLVTTREFPHKGVMVTTFGEQVHALWQASLTAGSPAPASTSAMDLGSPNYRRGERAANVLLDVTTGARAEEILGLLELSASEAHAAGDEGRYVQGVAMVTTIREFLADQGRCD